MIAALLRAALPLLGLAAFWLLMREAFLRWRAAREWERICREGQARHGRYISADRRHRRHKP